MGRSSVLFMRVGRIAVVGLATLIASCAGTNHDPRGPAVYVCAQLLIADPDAKEGRASVGMQRIDAAFPNIPLQVANLLKFLDETFTAAESAYDPSLDAGQKAALADVDNAALAQFRKVYSNPSETPRRQVGPEVGFELQPFIAVFPQE